MHAEKKDGGIDKAVTPKTEQEIHAKIMAKRAAAYQELAKH